MVSRMCLILLVLCVKRVVYILEQPLSSLMHAHPRLQYIINLFGAYTTTTYMGAFGAPTLKPSKLLSNRKWVDKLKRTADKELRQACQGNTVRHLEANGRSDRRVTGNKDELKATQVYPWEYARCVLHEHQQQCIADFEEVESESSGSDEDWSMPDDDWSDADLDQLAPTLGWQRGEMPPGANIFLR